MGNLRFLSDRPLSFRIVDVRFLPYLVGSSKAEAATSPITTKPIPTLFPTSDHPQARIRLSHVVHPESFPHGEHHTHTCVLRLL